MDKGPGEVTMSTDHGKPLDGYIGAYFILLDSAVLGRQLFFKVKGNRIKGLQ